jgi:hypothetical protein
MSATALGRPVLFFLLTALFGVVCLVFGLAVEHTALTRTGVALAVSVAPWPLLFRALWKSYASWPNAPGSAPSVSNAIRNGALGLTFALHGIVSNGLWNWAEDPPFAIIVLLVDAAPAVGCTIAFFLEVCALIVLRKPRSDARRE